METILSDLGKVNLAKYATYFKWPAAASGKILFPQRFLAIFLVLYIRR